MIDGLVLRLCDALPDVVFLLDPNGAVRAANQRAARLLGIPPGRAVGRSLLDFVDGDEVPVRAYLGRCARSGSPLPGSLTLETPSGPTALQAHGAALRAGERSLLILLRCTEKGRASRLFLDLNARLGRLSDELHRRSRLQTELRRRLHEREVLLKEVHHRVRNNLQVITSFINLQAHEVKSAAERHVLREVLARVRALGLIHGQLYAQEHLAEIDLGALLPDLCAELAAIYGRTGDQVRFAIAVPSWPVEIGDAVPVALLITEVVTNALQHAFPGRRSGTIRIELEEGAGATMLRIADDGVGWHDAARLGAKGSLGLRLMEALADQIGAELEIRTADGVEVRLALPDEPVAG